MSGLAMLTQRFEVWSSVANVSMEVYNIADAAVEDLTRFHIDLVWVTW